MPAQGHSSEYDFLVLGAGMGGLTVASLLARAGHRVCVLEAHEHPGGRAHSFRMGDYTFCAATYYIFFCGEGEPVYNFLRKLGLHQHITFARLDPEGYDHFRCPSAGLSFRIPNGLDKWQDRLIDRYPACRAALIGFFTVLDKLIREWQQMPFFFTWKDYLAAPFRHPNLLRYRSWTLQRCFDQFRLPAEVQTILSTQIGDLGLPPARVSLLAYTLFVRSYGLGAYYPTRHFKGFIDAVAGLIQAAPGSRIEYNAEVKAIRVASGRVTGVETTDGRAFTGNIVISNMDPQTCVRLIGREQFPHRFLRKVDYRYSASSFTVYLGLRGIDLREHGFGNWNVWHFPHLDVNRAYQAQVEEGDLADPGLFLSTPTLLTPQGAGDVCPEDGQILQAATGCACEPFHELRKRDPEMSQQRERAVTERILDILEAHYVPGLRRHIVCQATGSPMTTVCYPGAPEGNNYGSELSPANVNFSRLKFKTPLSNLYFTGASAEYPSVGMTVVGGCRLYTHLTGDSVNPGWDLYGLL
jgi:phytoene dehydrogenase-like protein